MIHLGVVSDSGGHRSSSDIFDISWKHPPAWLPRREEIIVSYSLSCKTVKEPTLQKSSPLPHSGRRIKSSKTDEAKKVGAKKLDSKGFLCSSALSGEVISSVALYKPHQMQQAHTPHNLTTSHNHTTSQPYKPHQMQQAHHTPLNRL